MSNSISSPFLLPHKFKKWGWKFQPSYHALVLLVASSHPELYGGPQSPFISLAYNRHSYHSVDSKGFRSCVSATRHKNQTFIFYYYYITAGDFWIVPGERPKVVVPSGAEPHYNCVLTGYDLHPSINKPQCLCFFHTRCMNFISTCPPFSQ